jgi:hypothetical protein
LTALVGVTAIAIDGGMLMDNKRRVQAASDAAALAAAGDLFYNWPTITATTVADPGGVAKAAALDYASKNGFPDGAQASVTVNIPPLSGPFTGKLGYVEVIIVYHQPRYFSTIWGTDTLPVTARSVAVGRWIGTNKGIIVLDPTVKDAFVTSGGSSVVVNGNASVIVDSSNPTSAAAVSGSGGATAANFYVTGGVTGTFTGTVITGYPPTPDPLAYLPLPPVPPNGTISQTNLGSGNKQYVMSPGRFTSMPNLNQGDVLILKQASAGNNGIYYLDGCGFSSQGANIMMDPTTSGGVMIYNNPSGTSNNQGIGITGNASGSVNLSALTSGPYAGILFFQNRTATQTMSVAGSGSFSLVGTFYVANAALNVSGGGAASIGSQYISRTMGVSGGGTITINYSDAGTAKERDIYLVE